LIIFIIIANHCDSKEFYLVNFIDNKIDVYFYSYYTFDISSDQITPTLSKG
jgi:hypothetical protein